MALAKEIAPYVYPKRKAVEFDGALEVRQEVQGASREIDGARNLAGRGRTAAEGRDGGEQVPAQGVTPEAGVAPIISERFARVTDRVGWAVADAPPTRGWHEFGAPL